MTEDLIEKHIWVEKYRPKKIEDMALPENYKKTFEKYIKEKNIPHMLLIGVPGSGKTAVSRILVSEIIGDYDSDLYQFNGSTDTGVNIIRNNVEEFLKTPAIASNIKIVFIDEFDHMSSQAQAALRGIMEKYSETGRFIYTANYKDKIIEPLFSRVSEFKFKKMPKEFVLQYVFSILDNENIEYEKNFVEKVIGMYYPDIRRIINNLYGRLSDRTLMSDSESLVSIENNVRSYITDLCSAIKNDDSKMKAASAIGIKNILKEHELDYISLYTDMFEDESIPMWAKAVINKYANKHRDCMIPAMHFMSMVFEIGKTGSDLFKLKR